MKKLQTHVNKSFNNLIIVWKFINMTLFGPFMLRNNCEDDWRDWTLFSNRIEQYLDNFVVASINIYKYLFRKCNHF